HPILESSCRVPIPFQSFAKVSLVDEHPLSRPQLEDLEDRLLPNNFFSPGSGLFDGLFLGKHMDSADEALVAALSASQHNSHGNEGNPGVPPPQSHPFGQTYGEWE